MADRDFKGVWIPKDVWLDKNLTMLDKGILVEIDSLDMGEDGCWASNEYLANFCQCSVPKVATAISKLVDLGYIKRESFDGRRRKLKSCLSFFKRQTYKNYKAAIEKVDTNNTSNNKENKHTPRNDAETVFTDGFDEFWAVYPKKDAKQAAIKAWKKLKPDDELKQTIIDSVRRNIDGKWKDSERRYIPNPATYLNGARWEDESAIDTADDEYYPTYQEYHEGDEFIEPEGCTPVGGRR